MKLIFFITTIGLLINKCFAQKELLFSVIYDKHKIVYRLPIPTNYKLTQGRDDNGTTEKTAHLKDGSVIYITDDLKGGGGNYNYKIEKYGTHYELNNYILNDTATLYGTHNGKYWRERKYYTLVVGYYNATVEEKAEYDKLLESIVPQVDKLRAKFSVAKPHK